MLDSQQNAKEYTLSILETIENLRVEAEKKELAKVKEMHNFFQKIGKNDFISAVNWQSCVHLKVQIDLCPLQIGIKLLDVVKLIVERGAEFSQKGEVNVFFTHLYQSGLIMKVEEIILRQHDLETLQIEDKNESESSLNLIWTLCCMMKCQKIEGNILTKCSQTIIYHINNFSNYIKRFNRKQQFGKKREQEEFQNQHLFVMRGIKMMKGLRYLVEESNMLNYFLEQQILETVSTFIHINCSEDLECDDRIDLPSTLVSQEILSESLCTVAFLTENSNSKQYIIDYHQILAHVRPYIINFAQQLQINGKLSNQQHQLSFSPHLAANSLALLFQLSLFNTPFVESASQDIGIITAIIILSHFQRKQRRKNMIWKDKAITLRKQCFEYLCLIQRSVSPDIQFELIIKLRYIHAFIEAIAIGGGSMEEDSDVIESAFDGLWEILYELNEGTDWCPESPVLIQEIVFQMEDGGGLEEIELHIFHSSEMMDKVKKVSDDLKMILTEIS